MDMHGHGTTTALALRPRDDAGCSRLQFYMREARLLVAVGLYMKHAPTLRRGSFQGRALEDSSNQEPHGMGCSRQKPLVFQRCFSPVPVPLFSW